MCVLRAGRDVFPFRQGEVISTQKSDFIPPAIMPGYNGHLPCVSKSFGNTYGNETQRYFQAYRNEVLSTTARPKYFYGRLPSCFNPLPDVAMAQKTIHWRNLMDNPNIRSISMDACRMGEIERFHTQCQAHRDYYLDKSEKVLPVSFFDLGEPWPIRCPADERTFKIKQASDACDIPRFMGPPLRCSCMPCIKHRSLMKPFKPPTLPRLPFRCGEIKARNPLDNDVLLV
jgi:hypothetical protein